MNSNRYLPIEADEDLQASDIQQERKSVKLFDTNVWKDPADQSGVVLTGYINQLYKEGYEPDQIATMVNLPVRTVKRKLNTIVNSFLGEPTKEAKELRRIEVDDILLNQIEEVKSSLASYNKEVADSGSSPDLKVLGKYTSLLSKLLEVRMKLWGLDDSRQDSNRGPVNTGIMGRVVSRIDDTTKSKIADFVIGVSEAK